MVLTDSILYTRKTFPELFVPRFGIVQKKFTLPPFLFHKEHLGVLRVNDLPTEMPLKPLHVLIQADVQKVRVFKRLDIIPGRGMLQDGAKSGEHPPLAPDGESPFLSRWASVKYPEYSGYDAGHLVGDSACPNEILAFFQVKMPEIGVRFLPLFVWNLGKSAEGSTHNSQPFGFDLAHSQVPVYHETPVARPSASFNR